MNHPEELQPGATPCEQVGDGCDPSAVSVETTKQPFIEPQVSGPLDVMKATTFFLQVTAIGDV